MATSTTWLKPYEVAQRLGASTRTVQQLILDRKLSALRVGRSWRVDAAEVDRYIRDNTSERTA